MKVIFVVHSFDKKDRGGVVKVVSDLTESFIERSGFSVDVVSFRKVDDLVFNLNEKSKLIDLSMVNYSTTNYTGGRKLKWFREAYLAISKVVESNKEAIWITSSPPISLLFVFLKIRYNIKVIGCDHISTLYAKNSIVNFIREKLISKLDLMVALTPPDKDYYISKKIKSEYIPNSIDFSKIKNLENSRKYIVFVGRFHAVKQPLKAMKLFIESGIHLTGIKMRMFGHGALHEQILEYIESNSYENYFEIITNESNQDNIFKDAYALLMTSSVEGFPMVLIEAIARNVPCLSFNCPYGPATIIKDGVNGYLLQDDPNDLTTKLNLVQSLHSLDISKSIDKFSIKNITENWVRVINNL